MIGSLTIRHFQSLDDVQLELGGFTAIVGPSSSGKSALVRSLRALTSNVRGTTAVALGATTLSVSARLEEGFVRLTRGASNSYEVGPDPWGAEGNSRFTKIGTAVPEEITKALSIPADGGLTFAGQFDGPFLLGDTGSAVARTLGELTNVDMLYRAAKEANRRRLASNAVLKTRQADAAKVEAELADYAGLDEEIERNAVLSIKAAATAGVRESLLVVVGLLTRIQAAQLALSAPAPVVPDIESVLLAGKRYEAIVALVVKAHHAAQALAEPGQQAPPEEPVLLLRQQSAQLAELDKLLLRIGYSLDAVARITTAEAELATELARADLELMTAKGGVAKLATVCPTCGSERIHWKETT